MKSDTGTSTLLAGDIPEQQSSVATDEEALPPKNPVVRLVELALDNRRRLLRVAVLTAVLTSIIVWLIPNRYESTTRLLPPSNTSSALLNGVAARLGLGVDVSSGAAGMVAGALKGENATFVPILESRTVQDRIIDRFDLRRIYRTRYYKNARKELESRSSISQDRQTGVITITVTDRDPQRAAAIAKMYVEELNRVASDLNASDAHKERVFIEGQLVAANDSLDKASKELGTFSSANLALDVKEQGRAMVEGVATLEGQLIAAQSELQGLEQIYGSENSRVRAARARVATLQAKVNQFGSKDDKQIYPGLRRLPELGVQYSEYYRRVKVQEAVFELLSQQYELAKIQEAKEMPTVRVLDPADVPEKKSFPPRTVLVIVAVALSVCLTILYLHFATVWARTAPDHPAKIIVARVQNVFARRRAVPGT